MKNNRLEALGRNLAHARQSAYPKDTQVTFSVRLGISRATYSRMEKGDLSVSMDKYFAAAKLLGLEEPFSHLFEQKRNILDD